MLDRVKNNYRTQLIGGVIVSLFIFIVMKLTLTDPISTHFNASGNADAIGSVDVMFNIALLPPILWVGIHILLKFVKTQPTQAKFVLYLIALCNLFFPLTLLFVLYANLSMPAFGLFMAMMILLVIWVFAQMVWGLTAINESDGEPFEKLIEDSLWGRFLFKTPLWLLLLFMVAALGVFAVK